MNAKDALKYSLDMGYNVLTTYLSDLTDTDLLIRPGPDANHLAWQVGHLISTENQFVNHMCPGAAPPLPSGFADIHSPANVKTDDRSQFLTKQEYLNLLKQQRQATKAALDRIPDAELDKPGPPEVAKFSPTVGTTFNLIGIHMMMHAGQFAAARRMLGKPVLI
jgi:hypothetical protein